MPGPHSIQITKMLAKRYGNPQNWNDTYRAGSLGRWKIFYEVRTAFDFLLILALLGILTAAILFRKRGLQRPAILFKPFIASIILYMISHLLSAIVNCIYLTDATVKMAFQLAVILQEFTYLLALCMILYLFYRLTFLFQERSTGRVSDGLMLFHGVIFGLMIPICVAEFATYVLNTVKDYDVNPRERLASHWIQVIRPLYTWLASLEIMIWGICLMVRTSRNDRKAKPSASSFLLGSIGFFAMNLMWAIITIQWDIVAYLGYGGTIFPRWIHYIEVIFPFFCIEITYIGILMCCTRLAGLDDLNIFPTDGPSTYPMMTYQNPYSNSPDMESRPMITEYDPARELWEAGSRPIHEADGVHSLRAWKP